MYCQVPENGYYQIDVTGMITVSIAAGGVAYVFLGIDQHNVSQGNISPDLDNDNFHLLATVQSGNSGDLEFTNGQSYINI